MIFNGPGIAAGTINRVFLFPGGDMSVVEKLESMLNRAGLLERLRQSQRLPSPPGIVQRISEIAEDTKTTMGDVGNVVSADPALSAKLLRIANSPVYGQRREVETLRQVVIVLGIEATISQAMSVALVGALRGRQVNGLDRVQFWRRSIPTASSCRALARRLGHASSETFFMAGLLQDLGMLAFEAVDAGIYFDLGPGQLSHRAVSEREIEKTGVDHACVGGWLINHWNLPEKYCEAVAASHEFDAWPVGTGNRDLAACAAVAGPMADVFCGGDAAGAAEAAAGAGHTLLNMTEGNMLAALQIVAGELLEVGRLFDLDVGKAEYLENRFSLAHAALGEPAPA